jgi:hypothetical protein
MHEYTDGMVEDVCADLKQWLEQLAKALSLGEWKKSCDWQ